MSDPEAAIAYAHTYASEEIAFRLFCAFLNVDHRATPAWWLQPPSAATKAAWLRVTIEAHHIFQKSS